jgi:hypothetical protein
MKLPLVSRAPPFLIFLSLTLVLQCAGAQLLQDTYVYRDENADSESPATAATSTASSNETPTSVTSTAWPFQTTDDSYLFNCEYSEEHRSQLCDHV